MANISLLVINSTASSICSSNLMLDDTTILIPVVLSEWIFAYSPISMWVSFGVHWFLPPPKNIGHAKVCMNTSVCACTGASSWLYSYVTPRVPFIWARVSSIKQLLKTNEWVYFQGATWRFHKFSEHFKIIANDYYAPTRTNLGLRSKMNLAKTRKSKK